MAADWLEHWVTAADWLEELDRSSRLDRALAID